VIFLSDAIFPTLPGIAWDITKSPEFYTLTKTSPTGLDVSAVLSAYPRWHFSLVYEFLRDDGTITGELQQLVGFFLQRYGNVDDFLYLDPTDNTVTNQVISFGDGVTKQFQLCRNFGGFVEPVYGAVEGTVTIAVNGVPTTDFSVSTKALVTFNTAPAANAVITWSGKFYYRVKFNDPTTEFNNFLYKLWEAKKVEFTSVKRVIT
jgi:uncharacterized protein (TIGR02217 family)